MLCNIQTKYTITNLTHNGGHKHNKMKTQCVSVGHEGWPDARTQHGFRGFQIARFSCHSGFILKEIRSCYFYQFCKALLFNWLLAIKKNLMHIISESSFSKKRASLLLSHGNWSFDVEFITILWAERVENEIVFLANELKVKHNKNILFPVMQLKTLQAFVQNKTNARTSNLVHRWPIRSNNKSH